MRALTYTLFLIVCSGSVASADFDVVGGTSTEVPVPFWNDCFWAITSSTDMAFPFSLDAEYPCLVSGLQVAAHHYEYMSGSSAEFSIHVDDGGVPGAEVLSFFTDDIDTRQRAVTMAVADPVLLAPSVQYWIVGSTEQSQVNWNLGDMAFGTAAYKPGADDWVMLEDTNVSAFALIGEAVPEPASLLLMLVGGGVLLRRR